MLNFYRGSKTAYPSNIVEGHELFDAIYFAEDTHEILVNGLAFGLDDNIVTNVELDGTELIFTYRDGFESKTKNVSLGLDADTQGAITELKGLLNEEGKLDLDLNYKSALDTGIATVTALGGIAAGTTVEKLQGKSFSEIFDMLIFPTVQPTKVDHTVTIARKSGVAEIKEVGADSWTSDDFNITTTLGEIRINGIKKDNYTGAASNLTVTGVPVTMTYGDKTITGTATFAEGPVPLDSKGGVADTNFTLFTGGNKSNTLTVYVVYPFYANASDITTFAKLPLVKSNVATFTVAMTDESGANTHTFKLPTSRAITQIEMLNTLSNQYETIALSNFIQTKETISVNGTDTEYTVYKRNQGENGAATFKITYKNS